MSLEKKDILAEEKRTRRRLLQRRREFNRSVLKGGGNIDISCKVDPEKKIKIKGYDKYDVYECKDKNRKILQDYKIKQSYRESEANLLKQLAEKELRNNRTSHNNRLLLKKFKEMKSLRKRNDILKEKLLKKGEVAYLLHGELIKLQQDQEEYRNRVLKFYAKMEGQEKIKRNAIMKGREFVFRQNVEQNIQSILREHIQNAEEKVMDYYVKKLDAQEKYHDQKTQEQLHREEELIKQLEDVKAQLNSATDVWSTYTTHIVESMNEEIEGHRKKREELTKIINEL